jgi:hypothetical protein
MIFCFCWTKAWQTFVILKVQKTFHQYFSPFHMVVCWLLHMCRYYLSTWWFVDFYTCADTTFPHGGLLPFAHVQILPFHMVVCCRLHMCRYYLSTWWFVSVCACEGYVGYQILPFQFPHGGLLPFAHVQILPFHMVACCRLRMCRCT